LLKAARSGEDKPKGTEKSRFTQQCCHVIKLIFKLLLGIIHVFITEYMSGGNTISFIKTTNKLNSGFIIFPNIHIFT